MAALQVDTPIQLVLFDMAGTTVDDIVDGKPVVMVAMQEAFRELRGEDVPVVVLVCRW